MVSENAHKQRWYQKETCTELVSTEEKEIATLVETLCGYHLIFLGSSLLSSIESSLISHRIIVSEEKNMYSMGSLVNAEFEDLPFRNDSVDVLVLPHILEHVANPHDVLREVNRVLIPEGHIIITGFNPFSCWGIWHYYQQRRKYFPKQSKMLNMSRLCDWLQLLNFQILEQKKFYFRPPLYRKEWHKKLFFLEKWGQWGWPFFGGAYILHAVKRVIPLTPMKARWRLEKALWQPQEGLVKPSTTIR